MRILMVSDHSYLPQRVGGAECSTHDLCLALTRQDYEIAVVASIVRGGWVWARNKFIRLFRGDSHFSVDTGLGYPVYRGPDPVASAAQVCAEFRPSVVLIQGGRVFTLARAYLELKLPVVIYLRDVGFKRLGWPLEEHELLGYIANSNFTRRMAEEQLGLTMPVAPPMVLPERYRAEGRRQAVTFINPVEVKGFEIALCLAQARSDIPFEFIECWATMPGMAERKARATALPNVTWRRWTTDGRELYRNAKIVLVPSLCPETWGRVVTEAHICGLPVLASNRGGLPESAGPGGILADPEGPFEQWLDGLSALWDDPRIYERSVAAVRAFAARPEIQPDHLVEQVVSILKAHISHCAATVPPDKSRGPLRAVSQFASQ